MRIDESIIKMIFEKIILLSPVTSENNKKKNYFK